MTVIKMEDTIVAIATALSKSAISIIRLSGPQAIETAGKLFRGKDLLQVEANTINYGHIVAGGEIVDEVLVSVFRAPKSFTGEDVVEINCHGGIYVTNKILELVLESGCRLAEPGEFTKRAFLNGRIDLTQAESVMDMIEAKTALSLKLATHGLRGDVRKMIEAFRSDILQMVLQIEVNIDYPEYEDEEQITVEILKPRTEALIYRLREIIDKSATSFILKEGISTAIIGKPNVGKSSLLNALLKEDKAIVTDIAGTTRDIVEGAINIGGIILNLIDTAGIRNTEDVVERIGVEKSLAVMEKASLIILMFDFSTPLSEADYQLLEETKNRTRIIVINKQDLQQRIDLSLFDDYVLMSTFNSKDIEKLERKIKEVFKLSNLSDIDYTYLGNTRQIVKIKAAYRALLDAYQSILNQQPIDIINIDLRLAWLHLGDILGEGHLDDVIEQLFANFCLGK
jgi:tRNA modification GTPase